MKEKKIEIIPSLLSIDLKDLKKSIKTIPEKIKYLHLDVMDGHFVDNITFGPFFVKTIRELTDRFLDVHLMISEPEKYYKRFIESGATHISFHIETVGDPLKFIRKVKNEGLFCGIALNPETPVENVFPFLKNIDYVLVMSVHPGFAGQRFLNYTLKKIKILQNHKNMNDFKIEIDGGINHITGKKAIEYGADWIVSGSFLFSGDIKQNMKRILNG